MSSVSPVYSDKEIYRYIDLGLGRGVDATDPTPWLNKTSFQVRQVTIDNIIGTDEGGTLQKFEKEVSSVRKQQAKMKAAVVVPKSPVTISTEAEYSRSAHSNRKCIGKKVVNRTISFSEHFNDVPLESDGSKELQKEAQQKYMTFEERLAEWVLNKLRTEWGDTSVQQEHVGPSRPLQELTKVIEKGDRTDMKLIAKSCEKFVEYFHITHYVNSIQLGAVEYQVMTLGEYNTAATITTKTGVDHVGSASTQASLSSKKKESSKQSKYVGFINKENKVEKGSSDEAVVDVSIKPICTLLSLSFLNACMQTALRRYMDVQRDKSDGPFLISCGIKQTLYLTVDEDRHVLLATSDINNASEFSIIPNDDKMGINEFYIAYIRKRDDPQIKDSRGRRYSVLADSSDDDEYRDSTTLYVDAPLSVVWGENPGPLFIRDAVSQKTSRFALNERLLSDKGTEPVPLESWTSGREMYYITCSRRAFRRNGYLAVKRHPRGHQHITCCIPDILSHDNDSVFMLFRLIPRQQEATSDTENDEEVSDQPTLSAPGETLK